jgi:hypothetical protein
MMKITRKVHVSAPYELLMKNYLDRFIKDAINPEIGLDAAVLDRYSADDFSRTAQILHSRNLSVTFHGPFTDLSPGSPDPMAWNLTQKRYEQVLRLVPIFKPKTLVCHAGYDWKRYSYFREKWAEKSIEMWTGYLSGLRMKVPYWLLKMSLNMDPKILKPFFKVWREKM